MTISLPASGSWWPAFGFDDEEASQLTLIPVNLVLHGLYCACLERLAWASLFYTAETVIAEQHWGDLSFYNMMRNSYRDFMSNLVNWTLPDDYQWHIYGTSSTFIFALDSLILKIASFFMTKDMMDTCIDDGSSPSFAFNNVPSILEDVCDSLDMEPIPLTSQASSYRLLPCNAKEYAMQRYALIKKFCVFFEYYNFLILLNKNDRLDSARRPRALKATIDWTSKDSYQGTPYTTDWAKTGSIGYRDIRYNSSYGVKSEQNIAERCELDIFEINDIDIIYCVQPASGIGYIDLWGGVVAPRPAYTYLPSTHGYVELPFSYYYKEDSSITRSLNCWGLYDLSNVLFFS